MARPKKTTQVVAEINPTIDVSDSILKQLAEMQKQLSELKAENEALRNNTTVETSTEEINGDTDIVVISQTIGKLVLSTGKGGSGNIYRFDKFGDVQDIPFSDLKDIIKSRPHFAKEGMYYIANEAAVKKLRLASDYNKIISNDVFSHILDEKSSIIISTYKNAPKLQQEQIVGMIEDRLANGQEVDGNVLVQIGKLCGKDFLHSVEDDE